MAQDFLVSVYDNVQAKIVQMSQIDAQFSIANFPSRYSLSGSAAAVVPSTTPQNAAAVQNLSNFRNVIDAGDFSVNPWQRGTTFTGITNSATYTADRFAARGAAGSSISVSKQAITAGALPGFGSALQMGRAAANADVNPISLTQVIETLDTLRLQGQWVTLSFYALAGANFSALNSMLNLVVAAGTGTDQGVTSMLNAAWTGYAALPIAAGGAANALSSSAWQRFYATFFVPTTTTELGVSFNYTPVGTAGANDWFQITGVQLEVGQYVSLFEHLDVQVVLEICQRYFWGIPEPANNVITAVGGATAAANVQNFLFLTPVQMRVAPTLSVNAGSWKVAAGAAAAAATGIAAGTTHTPNQLTVTTTLTQTAGQVAHLQGGGGAGYIYASADL
jgi:hypothetical protein